MKVQKVKMLVVAKSFMVFLTISVGCKNVSDKHMSGDSIVSQPTNIQADNESEQGDTQTRIINEIWNAIERRRHEEAIGKVDLLLSSRDCDEDTKATMLFLKADSLRQLRRFEEATEIFKLVIDEYSFNRWIGPQYEMIRVIDLCETGLHLVSEKDRSEFPESPGDYTQ